MRAEALKSSSRAYLECLFFGDGRQKVYAGREVPTQGLPGGETTIPAGRVCHQEVHGWFQWNGLKQAKTTAAASSSLSQIQPVDPASPLCLPIRSRRRRDPYVMSVASSTQECGRCVTRSSKKIRANINKLVVVSTFNNRRSTEAVTAAIEVHPWQGPLAGEGPPSRERAY